ncbi:unnamed protein product, partial [marine sediment metagenome]
LVLGDSPLPKKIIAKSDFFLFLASPSSIDTTSGAYAELELAELSRRDLGVRLGIVSLESFSVPLEYRTRLFDRFSWPSRAADAKRIVQGIAIGLAKRAGMKQLPGRSSPSVFQGGRNTRLILDFLRSDNWRGLYALNAVIPYAEIEIILREIRRSGDGDQIADKLVELFLYFDERAYQVAREVAVYLLGRMKMGEMEYSTDVKRRYPDVQNVFLARGFHIALGFLGDQDILSRYVRKLVLDDSPTWDRHRALNEDFHVMYYNSKAGALSVLRESISKLDPGFLLPLNVYTLGQLSEDREDLHLLEQMSDQLVAGGVERRYLRQAMAHIVRRISRMR